MAASGSSPATASMPLSAAGSGLLWRCATLDAALVQAEAEITALGLAEARLVWSAEGEPGGSAGWKTLGGSPDPLDALLVGRLVEHRLAHAQESARDGRRRRAALLVPPSEDGFIAVTWAAGEVAVPPAEFVAGQGASGSILRESTPRSPSPASPTASPSP